MITTGDHVESNKDMERRSFEDIYRNTESSIPVNPSPANVPTVDNVHYYNGLISGLENLPPLSSFSSNSNWNTNCHNIVPSRSLPQTFGDWTSYPTDDDSDYSIFNAVPVTSACVNAGDVLHSLSQPDSYDIPFDEGHYTTRSRSRSEHSEQFRGASSDFNHFATSGREAYLEALGQWTSIQTAEPQTYNLFGANPLLSQQADSNPVLPPQPELSNKSSSSIRTETISDNQSVAVHSEASSAKVINTASIPKTKPSYSEVAKNLPASPTSVPITKEKKTTAYLDKSAGFPDYTGSHHHRRHSYQGKSRHSRVLQQKHADFTPIPISPDSPYGLDTFEEPASVKQSTADCLSFSSGSDPHSRKGSTTSSGTGSFLDEQESCLPLADMKTKEEISLDNPNMSSFDWKEDPHMKKVKKHNLNDLNSQGLGKNPSKKIEIKLENKDVEDVKEAGVSSGQQGVSPEHIFFDPKRIFASSQNSPPATASLHTSSANEKQPNVSSAHGQAKQRISPEPIFFDPKRIFASRQNSPLASTSSQTSSKDYSFPNNQQAEPQQHMRHGSDDILNNDKPQTKSNSNINRSCYINNNLRETSLSNGKKQTNADAQRESSHIGSDATSGQSEAGHSLPDLTGRQESVNTHRETGNAQSYTGRPQHSSHPSSHGISSRTRVRNSTGPRRSDHPKRKPNLPPRDQSNFPRSPQTSEDLRRKRTSDRMARMSQSEWSQQHALGDLMMQLAQWIVWATQELGYVLWNITKLVLSIGIAMALMMGQHSMATVNDIWTAIRSKVYPHVDTDEPDSMPKRAKSQCGLKENIVLPSTGEDAMKRLLSVKGKDPYSILGVVPDAHDDVIKKYYRKQAVLVHPDKNKIPGAEEAFKVLGHAFDLIGEPEKRRHYDTQRLEAQVEEEAMHQFADLLTKLHDKMQDASNLMRCETCGGKHRRVPTERPVHSARFCQRCDCNHPAREGDVWAESRMMGFLWNYYACMDSKIYDITEWASCQSDRFKHIQANAHHIVYRIATNSNTGGRHRTNANKSNNPDLEDFLSNLFHQANGAGFPAETGSPEAFNDPTATNPTSNPTVNPASGKKARRKKKKH